MATRSFRSALLAGAAFGLFAGTCPAAAQSADAAGAEEAENAVPGDIIVTARKRQESILKVPVVETVLTAETLERAQITGMGALASRVPGLNLGTGPIAIGPQISLRGIGTSSLDAGIDQSVSLNIDGLSLTQGLAYAAGVFDLAQAEVLKGPQALFFGKNSPAGVISLRSNDPGDSLEVIARLGYEAEAREKRGELILSGPLSDTFGMRLAGTASFTDGFFRNRAQNLTPAALGARAPQVNLQEGQSFILRGTALWKPTADFTARLKLNWTRDEVQGDAGQGQFVSCPEGPRAGPSGIRFINAADNCKLGRTFYIVDMDPASFPTVRNQGRPFSTTEQKFGTLELNYSPSDALALTSVTGYYRLDADALINAILTGFSAPPYGADNHLYRHDFTQELRADTDLSGPFNLTAGAFYQKSTIFNRIQLPINRAILPAPAFPNGFLATGSHKISAESYSFFGQARYKIVPTLEFAAGVRWAHETRSDRVTNLAGAAPVDVSLPDNDRFTSSNFSPEATLTWTPTDDFTVFAAVKQGYKSGSFTITTPAPLPHFGDERARGGEVGLKTRLFDRQLMLNLAAYHYEYRGLQVGISIADQTLQQVLVRTLNAAGAKVYGVDFDFTYRPDAIEGLTIGGSANWNHARFTDFADATCYNGQTIAQGCNRTLNPVTGLYTATDLSGAPLVRAPNWQLNGTIDYEMPAGEDHVVRLGVAGQYTSRYTRALGRAPAFFQPGYATVDANVAFAAKDDSWEVSLVGRNLGNKITSGSCTASNWEDGAFFPTLTTGGAANGAAGQPELTCIPRRGRELWLRLTLRN